MKRTLYILSVILLSLRAAAFAGEFSGSGSSFSVDFPAGWTSGKSDDPAMVLKLEKGKSFFEFSKLDSELSDYYLKARVKEQVDSLRGKGNTISGEINQIGIRNGAAAYYTDYESMGVRVYIAFFTHNEISYAISASGLDAGEFRWIMGTIRNPGEKIEAPKPQKVKVAQRRPKREKKEALPPVFEEETPSVSSAAAAAQPPSAGAASVRETMDVLAGDEMLRAAEKKMSAEHGRDVPRTPYVARRPADIRLWAALALIWLLGALIAKSRAGRFQNPKLSPPPKDVPPDFFFPFIVARYSTVKGCSFDVLTRQKQRLQATFNSEHDVYFACAAYACLFLHAGWSLLDYLGRGELLTAALLSMPGGSLWASAPEIFCLVPLIAGISIYFNQKQALRLFDSNWNLLMEVKQEAAGCLIRDDKGKEIARIVRTGGPASRLWNFTDTDNQIVLSVKDDYPAVHISRMLFGDMGGALRSHYGIFASERRAGFVFLDPSSRDKFQVHLDFDFARLAHPAQILALVLYIISTEKEPVYPWI